MRNVCCNSMAGIRGREGMRAQTKQQGCRAKNASAFSGLHIKPPQSPRSGRSTFGLGASVYRLLRLALFVFWSLPLPVAASVAAPWSPFFFAPKKKGGTLHLRPPVPAGGLRLVQGFIYPYRFLCKSHPAGGDRKRDQSQSPSRSAL